MGQDREMRDGGFERDAVGKRVLLNCKGESGRG
jgi:hypothetical protein